MDCVAEDDDRGLVMKAFTNKNNQYNKKFLTNGHHNNTNGTTNGWCDDRKPRKRQRYHQPQQAASRFHGKKKWRISIVFLLLYASEISSIRGI